MPAPASKQAQLLRRVGLVGRHLRGDAVLAAQVIKHLRQPIGMRHRAVIPVAVGAFVLLPQAGEQFVQPLVVVSTLAVAQRHAETGDDVRRPVLVRLPHDGGDVVLAVLDKRQHRHHDDAGVDPAPGQHLHRLQPVRDEGRPRLHLLRQVIAGGRDGETDRRVGPVDLAQRVQVLEHQVALGDDVHREAKAGDDLERPPGQVHLGFQGHVGVVHRTQADGAHDALAGQFFLE